MTSGVGPPRAAMAWRASFGLRLPDRIVRPGAGLACIEDKYPNGLLHNERNGKFVPASDDVIEKHLRGEHPTQRLGADFVAGVYPLLPDETCWFLAADFDGQSSAVDALAYMQACRAKGVPAALERSRSGQGGHCASHAAADLREAPHRVVRRLACAPYRAACLEEGVGLLRSHGVEFNIEDRRDDGSNLSIRFLGQLREDQSAAFNALTPHDFGVLAATTAFGKTVIAAAMIAHRARSTLVLVHRRELLVQWIERFRTFLSVGVDDIGMIGGGRRKPTGLPSVARPKTHCDPQRKKSGSFWRPAVTWARASTIRVSTLCF
jgi:Type III restriction enzyme, res subunit